MFGFRTPSKGTNPNVEQESGSQEKRQTTQTERESPSAKETSPPSQSTLVRRSIGEIEAKIKVPTPTVLKTTRQEKPSKITMTEPRTGVAKITARAGVVNASPKKGPEYKTRLSEAKGCLMKAKLHLNNSRNLKTEIRNGVMDAVDRLYRLVKESEEGTAYKCEDMGKETEQAHEEKVKERDDSPVTKNEQEKIRKEREIIVKMEEHAKLLKENKDEMDKLKEVLKQQQEFLLGKGTYANVLAGTSRKRPAEAAAMHSIAITSKDENDTGEQVLDHIRKAVNAKEEGLRIDRIRKARDRKVIIGCKTQEEIGKVKDRIKNSGKQLQVEEIQNKDPLVILYGVLHSNSDEDILRAIRTQNKNILRDVSEEDDRMEVRFRKKDRNPLTNHVVIKVSPRIWGRITDAGTLHVDLQRIRVADQSPLIQCSRCLGYGHGRRFCRDDLDACSHCGGPHLRAECADWLAEAPPSCCNCQKANLEHVDHNAFSLECPIRKKWDTLARSTVEYC